MLQKRKGMRETEHAKIDEQSTPEGKKYLKEKNSEMRRQNGKKMVPLHFKETRQMSLILSLVEGSITLEFNEQVFISQPIGSAPLSESRPIREGLTPINMPLSSSQSMTVSSDDVIHYASKLRLSPNPREINSLLFWERP